MEENRINWRQILATAIVTGIVTIITGMLLFKWQTREPKLVYEVPSTSPFQGSNQNFAIYNVTISNRGGASINQVVGVIEVPQGSLEDVRITADPSLKYTTSIKQETLTLEIPQLNPNETISIAVLATSQHELPTRPIVSVRGSGLKGVETKSSSPFQDKPSSLLLTALAAAYSGVALGYFFIQRRRAFSIPFLIVDEVVAGKHREDQKMVIAYLCGVHGLLDDMEKYLVRPSRVTYWAESDRFAAIALSNPHSQDTQRRKQVLKDLLAYASIATLSRGIIHYNIAKISYAQGDVAEAREHLEKALKLGGSLIKTRLKVEPQLQSILGKNSA